MYAIRSYYDSYQVSASSKYPEEAVKFIDYLMSPEILLLTAWGTNNEDCVTYTEDADGTRTFTDLVTNNPDGLDYNTVRSLYMCAPLQVKYDEQMDVITSYSIHYTKLYEDRQTRILKHKTQSLCNCENEEILVHSWILTSYLPKKPRLGN